MAKLTLDDLDGIESLHRIDFYRLLTGEEPPFGVGTTIVHPYRDKINLDNLDKVMHAVELYEKRHGGGYGQGSIDELREAYKKRDLEAFRDGIGEIFLDIIND